MRWAIALLGCFSLPMAHAEPWLCTEPDGSRHFSYEPESATRKNCVHHPIPSQDYVRVRPRTEGQQPAASFPRVDAKTQKQRDATRRAILERELAEERKALAEAMKQLAEQRELRKKDTANAGRVEENLKRFEDRVRVHLGNISNLEKELGRSG